jgi:hypothetical protein
MRQSVLKFYDIGCKLREGSSLGVHSFLQLFQQANNYKDSSRRILDELVAFFNQACKEQVLRNGNELPSIEEYMDARQFSSAVRASIAMIE